MEIRTQSAHFPRMRGNGPRITLNVIHFPREVQRAIAGLTGYSAGFRGDDHHLGKLDIILETEIDGDSVRVNTTFGLRDWSGNWDDDYEGTIQFVVLAELAAATDPRPRGDLSITGLETTQAIQYFRSAEHLDGINVRPDNSIPLIARKSTALRVYVDYDDSSGLPPIRQLSGEIEVSTSIGSTTFTLSPTAPIVPRRDFEIDRADLSHTLNFVIPEGWCQGELRIRCKVFDQTNPNPPSRLIERTLRFHEREPLRLYPVAIRYTGQGLNLAAPSLSDILAQLTFLELTYPVPEVFVTGYAEIEFDKDMQADIDDGCGDGYSDLLGILRDMRGDSTDVYYGMLPLGINTGSVGGCGGGGVGASPYTNGPTMAQEIGHAFDRDHAPCGNPGNVDDDYPQYGTYPSGSIGEFGYDPLSDTLYDPASATDFMSYCGNNWVSPYTYIGLMGEFPATDGTTASAYALLRNVYRRKPVMMTHHTRPAAGNERLRVKLPKLHLKVRIHRDRQVERVPSFCFPAYSLRNSGQQTPFQVELLDKAGRTLSCQKLADECKHCQPDCYPRDFYQSIPFSDKADKMVIREDDTIIYEESFRDPPMLEVSSRYSKKDHAFLVEWKTTSDKEDEIWYLVQWYDQDGHWRGVAPRTREQKIQIPGRLFHRSKTLDIRILATNGLATRQKEHQLSLKERNEEEVYVRLCRSDGAPNQLCVAVLDSRFATVPDPEIIWYDESYAEVSRGKVLHTRTLPKGENLIRAVVMNNGSGKAENSWLIEHLPDGTINIR